MFTLPPFINDFLIILFSIVVEGIPFILIGAVLSAIMECWVTPERIAKMLPNTKAGQYLSMSLLGNIMPVCECGNIPFARRLISKKVPPHLALTFLLAAPVLNPIVIASTFAAFANAPSVLIFRLLFTVIIAISVGFLMSFLTRKQLIRNDFAKKVPSAHSTHSHTRDRHHSHAHTHSHSADSQTIAAHSTPKTPATKTSAAKTTSCEDGSCTHNHHHDHSSSLFTVIKKEFLEMTAIFFFGATLAATIQLFLPKDFVIAFNQQEWISIIAMMVLAFVVSICSNVDAFFALAYAQIFPTSSVLAFLVFGPMIDIKAIPMFRTIFTWRALALIIGFVASLSFLLSYLYFLFT